MEKFKFRRGERVAVLKEGFDYGCLGTVRMFYDYIQNGEFLYRKYEVKMDFEGQLCLFLADELERR